MEKRELEFLRDKYLIFSNFMEKRFPFSSEVITALKESNSLMIKACKDKHTRVLKEGSREVDLQIRELPLYLALELDKLFQEKLGISINSISRKMENEIKRVIKRGKILNDEEYYLIKEVYIDDSRSEDDNLLGKLIDTYEKSIDPKDV